MTRRLVGIGLQLLRASDRAVAGWLLTALAAVTAGGLAAGLAPLALKHVIDALTTPDAAARPPQLMSLVGLYVAALVLQRLCEQGQLFAYSAGEQRLVRRFSGQSYAHMLSLPLAFHLDNKSGALAQSLQQGVLGLRMVLTHVAVTILPAAVQLIVAAVVLAAVLGPEMGLLLAGGLAAYCMVFAWGVARIAGPVKGVSEAQVDVGGATTDGLMNVEAIKAYTAERRFARRYDALLGATEGHWRVFLRRRLENGLTVALVFGLVLGAVHLLAGGQVADKRLTLGSFVLVNTYLLQLIRPLEALGFAIRDIGQGLGYLDRIGAILQQAPEPQGPPVAANDLRPIGPATLSFQDVSFSYGDRATLRGVSFEARPGAMIGIVGPSGAGKSSLLRLILRFYEPESGAIRLDGLALADYPLNILRGQIALVSQDTILFNDTIAANIAFAADTADDASIAAAASRARLSELLADLPDGLDTLVGERGLKLSGGEKQRVSIARAALKQARLVIFDEATAALDPATERAVWRAMAELSQGATTLVVTHRLSTVAAADEILVLDRGRIVERGAHRALLDAKGLYHRLWGAQTTGNPGPSPIEDLPDASSF